MDIFRAPVPSKTTVTWESHWNLKSKRSLAQSLSLSHFCLCFSNFCSFPRLICICPLQLNSVHLNPFKWSGYFNITFIWTLQKKDVNKSRWNLKKHTHKHMHARPPPPVPALENSKKMLPTISKLPWLSVVFLQWLAHTQVRNCAPVWVHVICVFVCVCALVCRYTWLLEYVCLCMISWKAWHHPQTVQCNSTGRRSAEELILSGNKRS